MFAKYSLQSLLKAYKDNYPLINAYLKGESVEGYNDYAGGAAIAGMSVGIFLLVIFLTFGLWIWGLIITIKYWKELPVWAQVIAILGLVGFFVGPLLTIIIVYVGKSVGTGKSKYVFRY